MKLKVHTKVRHKEYGEGKINKITSDKVYVAFNGKLFIFDLPEAFENGYLIPIEDDVVIERKEKPEEVRSENIIKKTKGVNGVVLDANDMIGYDKIYEAINATVGTDYSAWMTACWPSANTKQPFRLWFIKLAKRKNGVLVPAANKCLNTISDDCNEVVYDNLKENEPSGEYKSYNGYSLIFTKDPKGGPYIFRGVFIADMEKSYTNHHVSKRVGTIVKLIGKPAYNIEILDDFRNK